jgi:hyaluronoglucosaminidase
VPERTFEVRGVVEGFYGTPWPHDARLEMLGFLGAHGMNAYVYAPKDDAKHRAEWRVPYDATETKQFEELAACGRDAGVRFGFALSPGLDIDYGSSDDRAELVVKMQRLVAAGVTWFFLLVDDIPMGPGLATRQAELAVALLDGLRTEAPDCTLTLCPTEYVGMRASPYLTELARKLPADVDVMWTGPTVCSPAITAAQAEARAAALGGRPPLLWDNYPVNDATMTESLHLGPYVGRDPNLAGVVRGVLCNPMIQPRASKVALATAAAFLAAPDSYDPATAWPRAIEAAGGVDAEPLGVLARACADSALAHPATLALRHLVDELAVLLDAPDFDAVDTLGPLEALTAELRVVRALPETFTDPVLAAEVGPWTIAARSEAEAGLAALRLLRRLRSVTDAVDDGDTVDAEALMTQAFVVMFCWRAARAGQHIVYGPRFALYTPVVQLADGSPAVDVALAVRENANAIDALCRVALEAYRRWTVAAGLASTSAPEPM